MQPGCSSGHYDRHHYPKVEASVSTAAMLLHPVLPKPVPALCLLCLPNTLRPSRSGSHTLSHVDFLELSNDRPVVATIPIKFTGVAQGVKDGGKLIIKMKSLRVKTLPQHLKENIEVNVTNLELNGNIRVEDVKEANYEILNSPRIPIASAVLTRELKQVEAAATPGAPAAAAAAPAAAPAAAAKPAAKGKK